MRQIKFRGKRTDNGEWIYGYYVRQDSGPEGTWHGIINNSRGYDIDPETIGQYTGLKDKNGTEIYESDLIKGGEYRYQVYWHPNVSSFVFCIDGIRDSWLFNTQIESDLEVIGNIHEEEQ